MMEDYKFTVLWKNDVMADIELYDKRRKFTGGNYGIHKIL